MYSGACGERQLGKLVSNDQERLVKSERVPRCLCWRTENDELGTGRSCRGKCGSLPSDSALLCRLRRLGAWTGSTLSQREG